MIRHQSDGIDDAMADADKRVEMGASPSAEGEGGCWRDGEGNGRVQSERYR